MSGYVMENITSKDGEKKKTFEFRMSKKVAELTQVVHMLFTRNHEKEVELEAFKDSYENEISLVIKDAKSKIGDLKEKIRVLEKQCEEEKVKKKNNEDFVKREEEWQKKVAALEKQVSEEKRECQSARDLLIQAQRDLEKLREGHSDELSRKTRDLNSKYKEIERLKQCITNLERRLKDADNNSNSVLQDLRRENDKIRKELSSAHHNLTENEKARESLSARNKQLESDLRLMKKELLRRADKSGRSSAGSRAEPTNIPEFGDELERLRKEVQRYRNELYNREENFNRMFTQQHPVVLDRRAGKLAFGVPEGPQLRYAVSGREPSFSLNASYPVSNIGGAKSPCLMSQHSNSRPDSREEDQESMSPVPNLTVTVSNANVFFAPHHGPKLDAQKGMQGHSRNTQTITARLPQLGLEARRQANGAGPRLAKPRPLPREMISAKAGGHG